MTYYRHDEGCSITGGYVYRGSQIAALKGRYIYGDYCTGKIWTSRSREARPPTSRRGDQHPEPLLLRVDTRGELYATSLNGTVYAVTG